jgi:hypothetical protein
MIALCCNSKRKAFKKIIFKLVAIRGEIVTLDHYHLPKSKIKGTRSTPYYSTKQKYILLIYFIIIIHIVRNHTKSKGGR